MLRVGTDCSGIEAPLVALHRLGVPFEHVFSSEICATTRKQLLANHAPHILYTDATARDNSQAPAVDLHVAGWGRARGTEHDENQGHGLGEWQRAGPVSGQCPDVGR